MNMDPFSKSSLDAPSLLNPSAPKDIFVKSKPGGSLGRVSKPVEAAEDQEPTEPVPAPGPEKPKAKVVLRNPKWESDKVGFNEEAAISVELELPPEHAHKTKVSFELFAKTPKGPEGISKGEGTAEGGKAQCKIAVYIPNFRDEDGNLLQKVEYYFVAKHSESDPLDGSKSPKLVDEMAERLIKTHILPDLTFGFDKSFLHPGQAEALKAMSAEIKTWREKNPEGKLAVFGHADAVGKEDYNKALSERRARSVLAFLLKDPKAWEDLSKEEKWGLGPIQDLLRHAGHDPGASDGKDGPKTQAAVKGFQADKGLAESGNADEGTRAALFQAFMESCETPALKAKDFDDVNGGPSAGCSEFNLVEKAEGACAANRRVTVLLLKSNRNFPITYPCQKGDVGPCRKQVARKGERRTAGFGCFFYDKLVVERKGGGKPLTGKVKFIGITQAEIKQYVNMETADGKPEQGMDRLLEVEVEGLGEGAPVHWVVTAGAANSKRTEPKTGPKPAKDGDPVAFENGKASLVSTVKGGKSQIYFCCGVGGGDEFTVEAGASEGKVDATVKLVTWRALEYETIQPIATGVERLTDFTTFTPDKKPGLPAQSQAYLDKVLGQGFVEFKEAGKGEFALADLPENGKFNVLDASYVGKPAGTKFLVATPGQLNDILSQKAKLRAEKRAVSIIWSDYLAERKPWSQKFIHLFKGGDRFTGFSIFEKAIATSASGIIGSYTIASLKWSATHWYDFAAPEDARWKKILGPADPGASFRAGGTFASEEDIKAHVQFAGMNKLIFSFPDSKNDYPGKKIKRTDSGEFTDSGAIIGLSVEIEGTAYATNFNGMALNGVIWMNTFAGQVADVGMAGVIAHELGHNMGQAYGDKTADKTFGRPLDKPIPGIPFPKPVPEGNVYGEHGHRGTHCATGVKNKGQEFFTGKGNTAFSEHECLMFGASDMMDAKEFDFCPDCLNYIKVEDLSDIHKSWRD